MKRAIDICLGDGGPCPLDGYMTLLSIDEAHHYYQVRGTRHPLAIYYTSMARLCPRITRFCTAIEPFFGEWISEPNGIEAAKDAWGEAFESMVYAAAEHADDLMSLASGFFKTHSLAKLDPRFKEFSNRVDKLKRLPSTIANKLKHEQARIRPVVVEAHHAGRPLSLHGVIVEGVEGGVVGPHTAIHQKYPVLSLTWIVWEILAFILEASWALSRFLLYFPKKNVVESPGQCENFVAAVCAAARLPVYTFGEQHAFARIDIHLIADSTNAPRLASGLYGSVADRWSSGERIKVSSFLVHVTSDGATKEYTLTAPKDYVLVHWP